MDPNEKMGKPVSLRLYRVLTDLRVALAEEFGVDFAFHVLGRGEMLAASAADGTVWAKTNTQDCADCQDRPGFSGTGRKCKTCSGSGFVQFPAVESSEAV